MAAHADISDDGIQPHLHAAWVGGVVRGGLHIVGTYPRAGEGRNTKNMEILAQIAAVLRASGPLGD